MWEASHAKQPWVVVISSGWNSSNGMADGSQWKDWNCGIVNEFTARHNWRYCRQAAWQDAAHQVSHTSHNVQSSMRCTVEFASHLWFFQEPTLSVHEATMGHAIAENCPIQWQQAHRVISVNYSGTLQNKTSTANPCLYTSACSTKEIVDEA